MKTNETVKAETKTETKTHRCGFCYDREHGKNGEVKREWAQDWNQFIPVCRKHSWGGAEGRY